MRREWFGPRLRELRYKLGLTQKQLAERSGVKLDTIRDAEQGRALPRLSTAAKLADGLGVGIELLLAEPYDKSRATKGYPKGRRRKPQEDA